MKRKQNKSEKSLINYNHFHLTKKISKYHLKNQISIKQILRIKWFSKKKLKKKNKNFCKNINKKNILKKPNKKKKMLYFCERRCKALEKIN